MPFSNQAKTLPLWCKHAFFHKHHLTTPLYFRFESPNKLTASQRQWFHYRASTRFHIRHTVSLKTTAASPESKTAWRHVVILMASSRHTWLLDLWCFHYNKILRNRKTLAKGCWNENKTQGRPAGDSAPACQLACSCWNVNSVSALQLFWFLRSTMILWHANEYSCLGLEKKNKKTQSSSRKCEATTINCFQKLKVSFLPRQMSHTAAWHLYAQHHQLFTSISCKYQLQIKLFCETQGEQRWRSTSLQGTCEQFNHSPPVVPNLRATGDQTLRRNKIPVWKLNIFLTLGKTEAYIQKWGVGEDDTHKYQSI